jgi:hypothetical protein
MRQRFFAGMLALGLVAGLAGSARADFNIATGLKWVPLRYTAPIGVGTETDNMSGPVPGQRYFGGAGGGEIYGWQTTSLDNYIALFFTEQIGIQLSLDFGYASHANDTSGAGNFNTSYFQLGIGLGAKFYLNTPTRERVSPYLLVNFFKYFASISTNDPNVTNDVASAIAGFASPVGADFAFGAEYFFTTSFSLGAEVLGIRFAHVQGEIPIPGGRISSGENYLTLYTGISLNYRFRATASVHTYEEEEDRANPRPKRKPKPRPVEPTDDGSGAPPPASPESVD